MLKLLTIFLFPLLIFANDIASKLTFITTISPCCSYPRTVFLQLSQYTFYRNIPDFQSIPKIMVLDAAKNPADEPAYQQFKDILTLLAATHPYFQNTKLVFCKEWKCLVGALKEAFESVNTEYVLVHQDDFVLTKPLDLLGLLNAMDKNHNIKHVRLNSGKNSLKESNSCDNVIDDYVEGGTSFPLLRTSGWSDNDHIARTDYYTDFVFPLIGENDKTFMEHVLNACEGRDRSRDPNYHVKYGTYLYGTWNEGPFIYHLDRKSSEW